jgi:hypothetical protein
MATATSIDTDIVLEHPRGNARERARGAAGNDDYGDVAGILGGSGVLLIQACALLPGLLPCLLLTAVLAVPLILPGIVIGLLVGLPVGLWRLAGALARVASRRAAAPDQPRLARS